MSHSGTGDIEISAATGKIKFYGGPFTFGDPGTMEIWPDGTIHIATGTSIIADL
jgi:hypothetical protein